MGSLLIVRLQHSGDFHHRFVCCKELEENAFVVNANRNIININQYDINLTNMVSLAADAANPFHTQYLPPISPEFAAHQIRNKNDKNIVENNDKINNNIAETNDIINRNFVEINDKNNKIIVVMNDIINNAFIHLRNEILNKIPNKLLNQLLNQLLIQLLKIGIKNNDKILHLNNDNDLDYIHSLAANLHVKKIHIIFIISITVQSWLLNRYFWERLELWFTFCVWYTIYLWYYCYTPSKPPNLPTNYLSSTSNLCDIIVCLYCNLVIYNFTPLGDELRLKIILNVYTLKRVYCRLNVLHYIQFTLNSKSNYVVDANMDDVSISDINNNLSRGRTRHKHATNKSADHHSQHSRSRSRSADKQNNKNNNNTRHRNNK